VRTGLRVGWLRGGTHGLISARKVGIRRSLSVSVSPLPRRAAMCVPVWVNCRAVAARARTIRRI